MRFRCLLVLLASAILTASTPDFSGKWMVKYTGPRERGLKTVGSIALDMDVHGDTVTGMAHIGNWPGDAPIADGKVQGNHISFNATGHLNSSSGIPTCHFEIDVHDTAMDLKMTLSRNPGANVYEFAGTRQ